MTDKEFIYAALAVVSLAVCRYIYRVWKKGPKERDGMINFFLPFVFGLLCPFAAPAREWTFTACMKGGAGLGFLMCSLYGKLAKNYKDRTREEVQ